MNIWTKSSARSARRSGARGNSGALRTGGCPSFSFPGCGDLLCPVVRRFPCPVVRRFPAAARGKPFSRGTRNQSAPAPMLRRRGKFHFPCCAHEKTIPRESGIKAHARSHAAAVRAKTLSPWKAKIESRAVPRGCGGARKNPFPAISAIKACAPFPAPVAAEAQKPSPREKRGSNHAPFPSPVAAEAQKPVPRESGITARARFPVSAAARGKFRCMLRREFV